MILVKKWALLFLNKVDIINGIMNIRICIKIHFLLLWVYLILGIIQPAYGAIFWKGKFKVISASSWKIEIIESYHGTTTNVVRPQLLRSDKTGLPFVTEDHWICRGRKIRESDVGQIYEFIGNIPDIGGCYVFWSLPQTSDNSPVEASSEFFTDEYRKKSLYFTSRWSQMDPFQVKLIGILLIILAILCFGYWMSRPGRNNAK